MKMSLAIGHKAILAAPLTQAESAFEGHTERAVWRSTGRAVVRVSGVS